MKAKTFGILGLILLTGLFGFAAGWVLRSLEEFHPWALPATSPQSEKLRWVEHADVVADFRQHVEQEHDLRFLHRYGLGFGSEFPGLKGTPEIQQLVQKYKSREMEAGSDIMTSQAEEELQHEITIYATSYNSMLLGYLECHK